jgi:hypothetical protein
VKATINLEYSSEELEKFLSNAGVAMLVKFFKSIKLDPSQVPAYIDYFKQGFEQAMAGGGFRMPHAHHHGPPGYPPPPHHHGPPGYPPPPPGYMPRPVGSSSFADFLAAQRYAKREAAPEDPNNVQPIHGEPPHVDRCFPVEATRQNEAGIACCQCATANGTQRTHCRNCGHKLCVIATPPPAPAEPSGTPE